MIGYRTISQVLAFVPGMAGVWLRRAWYGRTLQRCGARLFVDWLTVLSKAGAEVGNDVFIGAHCWIGTVTIGDDALISSGVQVLSGLAQHGTRRDTLLRLQPGELRRVTIGADCLVGAGAVVAASLGQGTVVGAGAVVVEDTEPYAVVVGNPARKVKER